MLGVPLLLGTCGLTSAVIMLCGKEGNGERGVSEGVMCEQGLSAVALRVPGRASFVWGLSPAVIMHLWEGGKGKGGLGVVCKGLCVN